MNRDEKITALVAHADDGVRRPALNGIDEDARRTSTFGSKAHRAARDEVEAQHAHARRSYEGLSEAQLDAILGKGN
jgi:hypothetical protein